MLSDMSHSHHLLNYGAFQQLSQETRIAHNGEYALYADGRLIAFFQTNRQAIQEAYTRGLQGTYSVMQVSPQPEDMGFFDSANYPR